MEEKSFKDLLDSVENSEEETAVPVVEATPVQEKSENAQVCIVDETSTTFVIENNSATDSFAEEKTESKQKEKKVKKKKQFSVTGKLSALQIVIICVVSVVALWLTMYTVDHTLAANGISPVFCKMTAAYEDGSESYKGILYKVQFKFDENGNLTQKCLPSWKDGPNDINTAQ